MTPARRWLKSTIRALPIYRRYIPIGLTLFAGIGLSLVTSLMAWRWEQTRKQNELQERIDKLATTLQRDFNSNVELLQAIGAFYATSNNFEKQEFQTFVKSTFYRHPSIQAIAWLPRVSDEQRQTIEQHAQAEGYPSFQITQQAIPGNIVTAQQRQEYFPAYYVVPLEGNEMLLGLDFAFIPTYRYALERARDNEEIVATNRIRLVQLTKNNEPNFLVFLPIYSQSSANNSLQARRENLRGFAQGVLNIHAIVRTALQELKLDNVNFYLEDATAPVGERFLAFYEAKTKQVVADPSSEKLLTMGQRADCPDGSACTRILNIENRRWLLRTLLTPEYMAPQKHWRVGVILILGLVLTSIVTIYLLILQRRTERIEQEVRKRIAQYAQLQAVLQELHKTQVELIQTEKMSTLGQLVAGVAHEINNPINFIYGNLPYTYEYTQDLLALIKLYQQHYPHPTPEILEYIKTIDLNFLAQDLTKILSSMQIGVDRICQIVLSLRNFSRLDEAEMKVVNIHEGIDNTLLILQHRLKPKVSNLTIEVIKEYGDLPQVECYPGALNQVFMNILANALDALDSYNTQHQISAIQDNSSRITIRTEALPLNYVMVRIADNGPGMTEEVKKRIFEPFFTTKPVGKGTGLGMSISYQIVVEKHGGALWCKSQPGQGTEFGIKIPVRQDSRKSINNQDSAGNRSTLA